MGPWRVTGRLPAFPNRIGRGSEDGFSLLEVLIATILFLTVASGSMFLLASARTVTTKPSHRTQGIFYAAETLDTLKDYVTTDTTETRYQFLGDGGQYALGGSFTSPGTAHTHLSNPFDDQVAVVRTYRVLNVDVATGFDADSDGIPNNDMDYQKVTVTTTWTDPK